jgi:hypothetical protein
MPHLRLCTEPIVSPRLEMNTAPAGKRSASAQSGSISDLRWMAALAFMAKVRARTITASRNTMIFPAGSQWVEVGAKVVFQQKLLLLQIWAPLPPTSDSRRAVPSPVACEHEARIHCTLQHVGTPPQLRDALFHVTNSSKAKGSRCRLRQACTDSLFATFDIGKILHIH